MIALKIEDGYFTHVEMTDQELIDSKGYYLLQIDTRMLLVVDGLEVPLPIYPNTILWSNEPHAIIYLGIREGKERVFLCSLNMAVNLLDQIDGYVFVAVAGHWIMLSHAENPK